MKNSLDSLQHEIAMNHCSEKNCATCFENRGCMYEQFSISATYPLQEPSPESDLNTENHRYPMRA